jgi:hypothetical protein
MSHQIPRPSFPQAPTQIDAASVQRHLRTLHDILTRYTAQVEFKIREMDLKMIELEGRVEALEP